MYLLRGDRTRRIDTLINLLIVLGALLILLAAFILLGDIFGLLDRFRSEIFLFVLGAILAYLLIPLVRLLERLVHRKWLAILASYLLLFLLLIGLGALLINPFISQARALVNNLHNPSVASLHDFAAARSDSSRLLADLRRQPPAASTGSDLARLQQDVARLAAARPLPGQISVPPSYVAPISAATDTLARAYASGGGSASQSRLVADATQVVNAVNASYSKTQSTPALLLGLQTWLDRHGFRVDLKDRFGKALQQFSNQLASLLNNALGIVLQAGTLLLNTVLMLIISVYFVSDGARFIRWLIGRVPAGSRDEAEYLMSRLDQILGAYLRTQVLMAVLAATLDASGAVVLGVPYPIVIFFSSLLLSLVPVIGPVVLPFPPMIIAVVFRPLPTPVFYLAWLLIGEQLATNVIGPRLQGHNVGIHPLEAMAAALIGFPLAGFLGAFFAVPTVAFLHVAVREIIRVRREQSHPAAA